MAPQPQGEVHLSFTDEESGCLLFALWSGVHAKVEEGYYPANFDVGGRRTGACVLMEGKGGTCFCLGGRSLGRRVGKVPKIKTRN